MGGRKRTCSGARAAPFRAAPARWRLIHAQYSFPVISTSDALAATIYSLATVDRRRRRAAEADGGGEPRESSQDHVVVGQVSAVALAVGLLEGVPGQPAGRVGRRHGAGWTRLARGDARGAARGDAALVAAARLHRFLQLDGLVLGLRL